MQREELKRFVISVGQTIRQAMETINENWREVVLVRKDDQRVIGIITDGDIRRGLLQGLTLDSPIDEVMNREFVFVSPEMDRAAVLDMMKALLIRQMPVIDSTGKLVGIHFLNDLLGTTLKPNVAVIMAGGKGTRLRPLTENYPKPMIHVAGRPILERVILHLVGYGIRKIYLAVNYFGDIIESYFGNGARYGCAIEYLREKMELGTGGALSLLPVGIEHPIIVMNGDQITQANINEMLEFHLRERVVATIGVKHYQVEIPFGIVTQEGNRLRDLQEKPTIHHLINAGIYVVEPEVLSLVPGDQEFPITSLFEILIARNQQIGVHYIDDEWIDVGRHDDLRRASGLS